jgi:UDP-2,3-diacylglucosamine pyrophosphatase LpxH
MKIRSLFISDIHLGSRHAHTKELIDFLTSVKKDEPEFIYIVGDFIDGWKLKRNWYWDDNATLLIRKIFGFIKRGTKVYLIAGNHDEFIRKFIDQYHILSFGNITITNEVIHESAAGKKMMVIHGDAFDLVTKHAKWLCVLGDIGYEFLLRLNHLVNKIRQIFRFKKWSLSKAVKYNVKSAVNYMSDFEDCLVSYGIKNGCDGVICGHIHHAEIKDINGFKYMNCGDFVESCSAIIEDNDGNFSLYYHNNN